MGSFFRKYQIIIWLSFIVVAMSIIKLVYKPDNNPPIQQQPNQAKTEPTETVPETTPSASTEEYEIIADRIMPLWRSLPYQGDGFLVENYRDVGKLIVKAQGITKTEAEKRVKLWIESKGFDSKETEIEISD